jgi:hypothetical protein
MRANNLWAKNRNIQLAIIEIINLVENGESKNW